MAHKKNYSFISMVSKMQALIGPKISREIEDNEDKLQAQGFNLFC